MAEVPIPPASLERLRATYAQFEQLAAVVAEAMGLPPGAVQQVSLPKGVFVTSDEPAEQHVNGVAAQV